MKRIVVGCLNSDPNEFAELRQRLGKDTEPILFILVILKILFSRYRCQRT